MRSSASTGRTGRAAPRHGAATRQGALPAPPLAEALAWSELASASARGLLDALARSCELPALTRALIIGWINRDRPDARRRAILELVCAELGHALDPGLIEALLEEHEALPASTRAALAAVSAGATEATRRLAGARGFTARERVELVVVAAAGHYLNILAGGLLEGLPGPAAGAAEQHARGGEGDVE
ncbi:MAG: hypothetical protein H6713_19290 [Myxococcales bacterium]|nr:hypothetical protein [Myxococcales bacterium]MCB9752115.1 hypothetical protein [Myxococcales bacterium]